MDEKIKVLIVDDQKLIAEGLKTLLETESDFEVVGLAYDGKDAISLYEKTLPDVVLMDVRMKEMDGVQATRAITSRFSNAKIIILTTFNDDEYLIEGIKAGAVGYLLKDVSSLELADAIRIVNSGGALVKQDAFKKLLKEFGSTENTSSKTKRVDITDREKEIICLIAQGLTNGEIAKKLYLSEGTVKNYITNILSKLGAKNRASLIEIARKSGII